MNGLQLAFAVFFCGGLGSLCRWWIHRSIVLRSPGDFPLGTFIVNVLGAFLIGVLFGADASTDVMKVAGAGFLGGFTTFSTWMYESERLAVDGHGSAATRNVAISSGVGLVAVLIGVVVGKMT